MSLLAALAPVIIAVVVVILLIWLKVATMRMNRKLKEEGKPPIDEGPPIVNVIDWTKRRQ